MEDLPPERGEALGALVEMTQEAAGRDAALAAALGALLAILRAKGVLTDDDQETLFGIAEVAAEAAGQPSGSAILASLRMIAEGNATGRPAASPDP